MFYLRRVERPTQETNGIRQYIPKDKELSKEYTTIKREDAYEHFCFMFKSFYGFPHVADNDPSANEQTKNTIGFIEFNTFGDSEFELTPIFKGQDAYIMTESGKTYTKVHSSGRYNKSNSDDYKMPNKEYLSSLLHKFFNPRSDANKYLEASQQEDLEKRFSDWIISQ